MDYLENNIRTFPIPHDTSYKGLQFPKFLDEVTISHHVEAGYIQGKYDWDDMIYQSTLSIVESHFPTKYVKKSEYGLEPVDKMRFPHAFRVLERRESYDPKKVYAVIGIGTMREGAIFKDESNYFITNRVHKVVHLASTMNEKITALLTDINTNPFLEEDWYERL